MDELNTLKSDLKDKKSELIAMQSKKTRCLNMASDIDSVYDRMRQDKSVMQDYYEEIKRFYKEKFDKFDGVVYDSRYKIYIEQLVADYEKTIKNIDINMDRLNTEKARYENEAYRCNGLIGYLQSAINSIAHQIENWTN